MKQNYKCLQSVYLTTNVNVGYQYNFNKTRKFGFSLAVQNFLDKKYIEFINASYYQLLGNSSTYYYSGVPRTLVAQVSLDF